MSRESVAQDKLRAYVDRIIRLKEEVKALNSDVREIYGEAKSDGYDKTILGKLVNYVEKREADPSSVMEADAIFETYLEAYYGAGTAPSHAHAREDVTWQMPRVASLGDQKEARRAGKPISQDFKFQDARVYVMAFPSKGALKIGVSNDVDARLGSIMKETGIAGVILHSAPGNRQVEMALHDMADEYRMGGEWFQDMPGLRSKLAAHFSATHTHEGEAQKVERRSPKPEDAGSIPATFASAGSSNGRTAAFDAVNAGSTPAPAFNIATLIPKPLRPHCQRPERCGGQGREHCYTCKVAAEQGSAA